MDLDVSERRQIEQLLLRWFEGSTRDSDGAAAVYRRWTHPEFFLDVIEALNEALAPLVGTDRAEIVSVLGYAFAWIIEQEDPGWLREPVPSPWSPLRSQALESAAEAVGMEVLRHRREGRPQPRRYARHLGLVSAEGIRSSLTPSGVLALELSGSSMIGWLLALERAQSVGPEDAWHVDEMLLRRLVSGPFWFDHHDFAFAPLHERGELGATLAALGRLRAFGVVTRDGPAVLSTAEPDESYELTQAGHVTLAELLSEPESPLSLLARAVSEDQGAAPPVGLLAAASRELSAVTDASRHMRMIAHEIRNALVPVEIAFERLWRHVSAMPVPADVAAYRGTIVAGLRRMARFVDESARVARLTASPPEPFDAVAAIGDAISALQADFERGVRYDARFFAAHGAPLLIAQRDRFVLAVVNLLRNAVQAGARSAKVTLMIADGGPDGAAATMLTIVVEDDGAGIPAEHRSKIFDPGFSLRDGGTGHGLALVREVVEVGMHGRIACADSSLGGARFTLDVPYRSGKAS